jgi:hypothetical protein
VSDRDDARERRGLQSDQFAHAAFLDPGTQVWNTQGFSSRIDDRPYNGGPEAMVTFVARPGKALSREDGEYAESSPR